MTISWKRPLSEEKEYVCPECGQKNMGRIYQILDVTENPLLKEKIKDLSLFWTKCSHCGHKVRLEYPCLYIDGEREVMIYFLNRDDKPDEKMLSYYGEAYHLAKSVKKRLCRNLLDFIEKISVFDSQYDDRAVELLKMVIMAKQGINGKEAEKICFYRTNERGNLEFTVYWEKEQEGIEVGLRMYEEIAEIVSETPSIMEEEKGFCIIDREWAGKTVLQNLKEKAAESRYQEKTDTLKS
jgi:DNA-directed RNA polymerase subunit RPC12/RpoP